MQVLDLDLDFFVRPAAHFVSGSRRLSSTEYTCATADEVEDFLERQCGLSKERPIPGRFCQDHDEAFDTWKDWIRTGRIEAPFDVAHVDAHADMGLGDPSWTYLLAEVLALPLDKRGNPRRGWDGLNSGSYLPFAIANRWLRSLTYVFPPDTRAEDGYPTDIHTVFFRNEDWKHGPIELPHFTHEQLDRLMMMTGDFPEPLFWEPAVANSYVPAASFSMTGFTHMILAQSPGFTPETADALIPVIEQYFLPR
jgi:UPF0489 domain